jgi:hypothetical protein
MSRAEASRRDRTGEIGIIARSHFAAGHRQGRPLGVTLQSFDPRT